MSRAQGRGRSSTVAASVSIVVLSLIVGFVFAGTGREGAARSEAQEHAAAVAAVRIVLAGPTAEPPSEAPPDPTPQKLIEGADHVGTPSAATRIVIAAAGIDAEVRTVGYTFDQGQLQYDTPRREAGHYVGSADPGEQGNTVIAGHVSTRSGTAVFERLPEVDVGDVVEVYSGEELHRYQVTELRVVAADDLAAMARTSDATLTLITCFPDRNYQDRLIVIGKLL